MDYENGIKNKFLPKKQYYRLADTIGMLGRLNIVIDRKTNNAICKILNEAEAKIKKILKEAKDVRLSDWAMVQYDDKMETSKRFYYPLFDKVLNHVGFDGASHDPLEETINNLKIAKPKLMGWFFEIKNERELEEVKEELEKELKEKL